jgi:hypothetical protein
MTTPHRDISPKPNAARFAGRRASTLTALGASLLIAGCYYGPRQLSPSTTAESTAQPFSMARVEVDEAGWFWNAAQADSAMTLVTSTADKHRTAVVVFVHGWKHNGDPEDSNLLCLQESLTLLSRELNKPAVLRGGNPIHVVGIFIGWRGKSMPSIPVPVLSDVLEATTFWNRKEAANRVGRGNIREFLKMLGHEYDERNPTGVVPDRSFGLVTIGHSFGAQVVFRAVADDIQSQLVAANGSNAWKSLRGEAVTPRTDSAYIKGVGDLVLLVNPAIEAIAYEPLRRLASTLTFKATQTPALVIVTADNDMPNRSLFHWGRLVSTLVQRREPKEQFLERSALGTNDEFVTHLLDWAPNDGPNAVGTSAGGQARGMTIANELSDAGPRCIEGDPSAVSTYDALAERLRTTADASAVDLTDSTWIGGVRMSRFTSAESPVIRNSPLAIMKTISHTVIDNHSGFFTYPFIGFLRRYVTDIEEKRDRTRMERGDAMKRSAPR